MERPRIGRLTWFLVLIVTCAAAVDVSAADPRSGALATELTPERPNIVLIVTDDQRRDTLPYMPIVNRVLGRRGIEFTDAYVVNPLCCPSRATMLTGLNSHSTGVYTNHGPSGGFPGFDDDSTIATWLQATGYRTALFGKYLNAYGSGDGYVPPGWDRWFATYGGGAYYDYLAVDDGVVREFGSDASDYGTTVLRDEAVSFILETDPATPLFMYWAVHAPHQPATPDPSDREVSPSPRRWRPESYDEPDVTDKPEYLRTHPRIDARAAAEIDAFRRGQIRSLQAVDRAIGAIVSALRDADRLHDTMIVFTSDNGMLWGEHRWSRKSVPYEEAIGVPFVVRYDALITEPRGDDRLVLNLDLAPTFAALAGADAPEMEGRSFLPLLGTDGGRWRHSFLIEHLGEGARGAPTFCAVHTNRFVLVHYATSEEELYDLARDPGQLVNRDGWDRYRELQQDLRSRLRHLCDPVPPGFSF